MKKIIFCSAVVLVGVVLASIVNKANAAVIYSNDFESAVGSEWSNTSTDITPADNRRFLGQFSGDDAVSLSLNNLSVHNFVTLSFDLYVIQSWDGVGLDWGPDVWQLSVNNGPVLVNTTFSNTGQDEHSQSYPGPYSGSQLYPAYTGAAQVNTLGYDFYGDSVYSLSFIFEHCDSSLSLNFAAFGLQGICDESWGLDNINVALGLGTFDIPEPASLTIFAISGLCFLIRRTHSGCC